MHTMGETEGLPAAVPWGPEIRKLTEDEAIEILERNRVGRLALARANRVDIAPIHYVYHDGWLYGRTSPGTKLEMAGPDWWPVAFEVDEVEGLFDWRSVVVHGGFYALDPERAGQAEAYQTALEQVRRIMPDALTDQDPVPERSVLFRIAVQEVDGRRSEPHSGSAEEKKDVD